MGLNGRSSTIKVSDKAGNKVATKLGDKAEKQTRVYTDSKHQQQRANNSNLK